MRDEIEYSLKTCESDKTLSLRVPSWMKDKLAAVARSKGTTLSAVALSLIKHSIMEKVRE
jgi:predicted DNA-binding protein